MHRVETQARAGHGAKLFVLSQGCATYASNESGVRPTLSGLKPVHARGVCIC